MILSSKRIVAPTSDSDPSSLRFLVVDPDASMRKVCSEVGEKLGFSVFTASSVGEAEAALTAHVDVMLLDLRVPGGSSQALLKCCRVTYPNTVLIAMSSFVTADTAIEIMKTGAMDFLIKPFDLDRLTSVLECARHKRMFDLESLRLKEKKQPAIPSSMIGTSPSMQQLRRMIGKVSQSNHPVLILGESGAGKELVAREIHHNGPVAGLSFIAIDCGALTPTLIESELFGHVRGAFTGATQAKEGLLTADQGTVFLDEIGELPLDLQAKLLRALQQREVRPVGSTQTRPIKARVVAATNRDLPTMVEQGAFRKDLYFRLNVVNIRVPSLRSRRSDIPLLIAHFLERFNRGNIAKKSQQKYFADDALALMCDDYPWPGNIRELENAIERTCMVSTFSPIPLKHLPSALIEYHQHRELQSRVISVEPSPGAYIPTSSATGLIPRIEELERQAILETIQKLNGDKLQAAKTLGIGKTTLYRKLKEYGIDLNSMRRK